MKRKKSLIWKFIIQFSHPFRTDEKLNRNGLRHLKRARITLKAMTTESWFVVVTRFVSDLDPRKILERDDETREILKNLKLLDEDSVSES